MDREQTAKLYEAHYMRVFSYAMTLSGDRELAEELTQETFFRAFSKAGEFRRESDEVTWLCAIAKNCFYDEKRRQSKTIGRSDLAVRDREELLLRRTPQAEQTRTDSGRSTGYGKRD